MEYSLIGPYVNDERAPNNEVRPNRLLRAGDTARQFLSRLPVRVGKVFILRPLLTSLFFFVEEVDEFVEDRDDPTRLVDDLDEPRCRFFASVTMRAHGSGVRNVSR